jgi:hypothetical protein
MAWATGWETGIFVLACCIVMHTFGLNIVARLIQPDVVMERRKKSLFFSVLVTALVALAAALLHALEAPRWAALYMFHHALPDVPSAVLYSIGAFTTYGNSGVSLPSEFALLGQIQAINGVIAFGITTGFIFASAFRLHQLN